MYFQFVATNYRIVFICFIVVLFGVTTSGCNQPTQHTLSHEGKQSSLGGTQIMHPMKHDRTLDRSESFFGIHFDIHISESNKIGEHLSESDIERMLQTVSPDYVQIDCKGHPGISSYPTKVGFPAKEFVKDATRIWRDLTATHHIALYVHYSGIFDSKVAKEHPEWARVDQEGERSTQHTSVFSPYVDRYLIPQLRELASEYGIDGAWVDGECWALELDYHPQAIQAFKDTTGIISIPKSKDDPHFSEWMEFQRDAFRKYLTHYINTLHESYPDFQIASNWAFSSQMPVPVDVDMDFLSGDFLPYKSVASGEFEARCLAPQGKPWDLMAWTFTRHFHQDAGHSQKSATQLKQEAAVVMAMGGGIQFYFKQKYDAAIIPYHIPIMEEVAEFCRARQVFSHKSRQIPQVALLYSTVGFKHRTLTTHNLYRPWGGESYATKTMLFPLLDNQYAVEILMDHHLQGQFQSYPVIVVPQWEHLGEAMENQLKSYVEQGGTVLIVGAQAVLPFIDELGVTLDGERHAMKEQLGYHGNMASIQGEYQPIRVKEGTEAFAWFYKHGDMQYPDRVAATVTSFGEGKIGAVYFDMADHYYEYQSYVVRELIGDLMQRLFPTPLIEIEGTHLVHVNAAENNGNRYYHLINNGGEHNNSYVFAFDEIPPLGPFQVRIRHAKRPKAIVMVPENQEIPFTYNDGIISLTVPQLVIHSALRIDE
jgi:hypothetical protein